MQAASSWTALWACGLLACFSIGFANDDSALRGMAAWLECAGLFLLIAAWHREKAALRKEIIYALLFIFFFRLIHLASYGALVSWPLRSINVQPDGMIFLWHIPGLAFLHPAAFRLIQRGSLWIEKRAAPNQWLIAMGWIIVLTACFWAFRSVHISRDGQDWIIRSAQPVWHLYLREPLTIGLYRAAYLTLNPWGVSTPTTIALVSAMSGSIALAGFMMLTREMFSTIVHRVLSWLLFLSCGGMMVLFFGHIEVYPVLCAGFFWCAYFAKAYLNGRLSIAWAGIALSITFILHLSTGWILPAFFLLPFFTRPFKKAMPDCLTLSAVFFAIQIVFWLGLIMGWYQSDVGLFLARLHETFHVGLDRSMFMKLRYWFHPWHFIDLFAEYSYLSLSCMALMPIALSHAVKTRDKEVGCWLLCFAGYALYVFLWNPDRGYPEDWDLFSPVVPLMIVFISSALMPRQDDPSHCGAELIYLCAVGFIPFSISQIWYHHTIRFMLF